MIDPVAIEAKKTPASAEEVAASIRGAYKAIVGHNATDIAVEMLLAQSDLETATWAAMWNWNVGNITHASGDQFDWMTLHTADGDMLFRAYASLDQGAADFVLWLKKHNTLSFAERGDLRGYVNALAQAHYFGGGSASDYLAGMQARMSHLGSAVATSRSSLSLPAWLGGLAAAIGAFFIFRKV